MQYLNPLSKQLLGLSAAVNYFFFSRIKNTYVLGIIIQRGKHQA